jgi:hypothetical protein
MSHGLAVGLTRQGPRRPRSEPRYRGGRTPPAPARVRRTISVGAMRTATVQRSRPPIVRVVGSDIVHAVPLTLVAGIGHWILGSIDWNLLGSQLAGSLPGIVIGSHFSARVPDAVLRVSRSRRHCSSPRASSRCSDLHSPCLSRRTQARNQTLTVPIYSHLKQRASELVEGSVSRSRRSK